MTFFMRKRVANSEANKYAGAEDSRRAFSITRKANSTAVSLLGSSAVHGLTMSAINGVRNAKQRSTERGTGKILIMMFRRHGEKG
jgi:hypothetical protein